MEFDEFAAEQTRLKGLLLKGASFDQGIELCGRQNAQLHGGAPGAGVPTIWDNLVADLTPQAFVFRPEGEFESIAWCTWHITRIEDAIGNILIAGSDQVFNAQWKERIGVPLTDTANAFTKADVDALGATVNMGELLRYRNAVGLRSQEVIRAVRPGDIRRKPDPGAVERIVSEGVLTQERESIWLKDFWAKKTIGGLLLLPMTRHQMMHIPNGFRLKAMFHGA